jgi:RNA polymerase sigma factor (sigma-70 family)
MNASKSKIETGQLRLWSEFCQRAYCRSTGWHTGFSVTLPTPKMLCKMLFSPPIPTWTSSKGRPEISSWLTSIVLNSARMQLRRRRRQVQVPLDEPSGERRTLAASERLRDDRPSPEEDYRDSELRVCLTHLHRRLSPTLGRTFQLRDIEGLSIRETARILGVRCGTVKARSTRARKKIKEFMHQGVRWRSSSLPGQLLGFANPARSSALAQ